MDLAYCQLRARRALSLFKDVPLRTRRALSLYKVYGNSALLILSGTLLNNGIQNFENLAKKKKNWMPPRMLP